MNEKSNVIGAGRRVRELRDTIGVSAKSLSVAAGFSPGVVSQLETGYQRRPCAEMIVNLAALLGTSAEYLMRGVGRPPTPEQSLAAYIRGTERGLPREDQQVQAAP